MKTSTVKIKIEKESEEETESDEDQIKQTTTKRKLTTVRDDEYEDSVPVQKSTSQSSKKPTRTQNVYIINETITELKNVIVKQTGEETTVLETKIIKIDPSNEITEGVLIVWGQSAEEIHPLLLDMLLHNPEGLIIDLKLFKNSAGKTPSKTIGLIEKKPSNYNAVNKPNIKFQIEISPNKATLGSHRHPEIAEMQDDTLIQLAKTINDDDENNKQEIMLLQREKAKLAKTKR